MRIRSDVTVSGAIAHHAAARHGRLGGRAGLSVEEVADSSYLVRLRRATEDDLLAIAADLERHLAGLDATDDVARRDALVEKAEAMRQIRIADYQLLCATYGKSWRRHHRDRRFVHLGWRCPSLRGRNDGRGELSRRGDR